MLVRDAKQTNRPAFVNVHLINHRHKSNSLCSQEAPRTCIHILDVFQHQFWMVALSTCRNNSSPDWWLPSQKSYSIFSASGVAVGCSLRPGRLTNRCQEYLPTPTFSTFSVNFEHCLVGATAVCPYSANKFLASQENVIVHCLFVSSKINLLIINEVINGGEIAQDSKRSV